ncbi:hypothetical protein C900_02671 [Fulvivirga imtechensis AK7]|uniref:Uncharacterized protein n=1 Tax=Fulvivirga imtechensis AK7 TaxID=1237149 RepID=L8JWY0_9BACT|nr:hypothetical protein C900_02671 [Fulvivirga imtechensis AK7]
MITSSFGSPQPDKLAIKKHMLQLQSGSNEAKPDSGILFVQ